MPGRCRSLRRVFAAKDESYSVSQPAAGVSRRPAASPAEARGLEASFHPHLRCLGWSGMIPWDCGAEVGAWARARAGMWDS